MGAEAVIVAVYPILLHNEVSIEEDYMFEADLSINFIAFMIIRTLFNKGSRVPLRGKVNEGLHLSINL